jgi:hypothetical protein
MLITCRGGVTLYPNTNREDKKICY